jgi:hypothetical protein
MKQAVMRLVALAEATEQYAEATEQYAESLDDEQLGRYLPGQVAGAPPGGTDDCR